MTDVMKSMFNLKAVEYFFFRKDVFQQLPKFWDVPLSVSKVIDETSDRISGIYFKSCVKVAVRRDYFQISIQN